jgi:hypothetical protein
MQQGSIATIARLASPGLRAGKIDHDDIRFFAEPEVASHRKICNRSCVGCSIRHNGELGDLVDWS